MDLKSTIGIILKDLEEARSLIDDLKNKPELSILQIELAKSKCYGAENLIKLLGEMLESSSSEQISINNESDNIENEVITIPPTGSIEKISSDKDPVITKEGVITKSSADSKENITSDKEYVTKPSPESSEVNSSGIEPEPSRKEQIIADKFSHLSGRINEKIRDNKNGGQAETLRGAPVKDLNEAIGINDRYFFLRELFMGEEDKYKTTIDRLNEAGSVGEATDVLKGIVNDITESEAASKLIELVERKLLHSSNG